MTSVFLNHQIYQRLMDGANYKDSTFRRIYKVKQKKYHMMCEDPEKEYELVFKDEKAAMFFKLRWL